MTTFEQRPRVGSFGIDGSLRRPLDQAMASIREDVVNVTEKRFAPQAYERLLDLIMSGELRPGTLVNERQLAEMFDVSRTPVRDALLMLESDGLVVRQGKRGMQIKQMHIEEFMDALQVRLLLEPEAARIAAGRVAAEALDEIAARLKALVATASDSDRTVNREEVRSVDEQLHELIARAVGNEQMAAIIRKMRRQTQIFDLKSVPERLEDTCREHLDIVRAIGSGDQDAAAQAMKLHLERVRQSIIARLTRM